jgi:thiamine pyrophosphokinase
MKKGLLFANGLVTQNQVKKISNIVFDFIVAADGGVSHAFTWGFKPDYVVGDLDSVDEHIKSKLKPTQFIHLPSQELNDLEKSLNFCKNLDINDLTIVGLTGKRLDHTINNLSVVSRYDSIFKLTIYDANAQIHLVRDKFTFDGVIGQTISLISIGKVGGITTEGLAYPLNNESLIFGEREGASNEIVSTPIKVQIKSGLLFIFTLYPPKILDD